ncbi:uncharacterized protein LOC125185177 [Salvia hispanica]|uniref:uncharacterized protein LOC125185177 n=1 Tax=Salvia hispanica TaxID=49212 RepID=UPI002009C349|nr:uncharacterized protein LOC125185177 [Salvia hispanica]
MKRRYSLRYSTDVAKGAVMDWWYTLDARGGPKYNDETQILMYHPSHPQHQLRFLKKTRWCPFPCDACGATEKGDSYICTQCDYWIHESCALLPAPKVFPIHHHHSLSLAFYPPLEYIRYNFYCAICNTTLPFGRWVYHCHLCSYVVHLNCATSTVGVENESAIDDEKEVTKFPLATSDIYEEMIRPFVKRQRGHIVDDHDGHYIIGDKYKFSYHPHLLTFTAYSSGSSSSSSSSSHHHYKNDEEEEEGDDEDDFVSVPRTKLVCDGCTLPIREKKQTDDECENGYMSCDGCKYFLHLSCFNLPLEISSLPFHSLEDYKLTLLNAGKLKGWIFCYMCNAFTNGLYYVCTRCRFNIDIMCASQPNAIKHAAHPRHNSLKLVRKDYRGECVILPATNKHRMDKHLLPLTYDAYVNCPGDFHCSNCESHMNRRSWMYYCRDCDQSFRPYCFPATSGAYRNIKYGTEQYVISRIHVHPLRFQIIFKKKRCDFCHETVYDRPGFQCVSCFFVVCKSCGIEYMDHA